MEAVLSTEHGPLRNKELALICLDLNVHTTLCIDLARKSMSVFTFIFKVQRSIHFGIKTLWRA